MQGSNEFICLRNSHMRADFCIKKYHPHTFFYRFWEVGRCVEYHVLKSLHESLHAASKLLIIFALEKETSFLQTELQ